MASINVGPFGDNWFKKPPNLRLPPINLLSLADSLNPFKPSSSSNTASPLFASISNTSPTAPPEEKPSGRGKYMEMLEQYEWECENLPDHRHTPEVEKILNTDPFIENFFKKKENPTPEEVEENEKWWAEFRDSPVVQFLQQAKEIGDKLHEMEMEENAEPHFSEDVALWKAVPNVIGLDGRPMPRKSLITKAEANDKFWDFARQFFLGLWGFRQRPYPPGRPIDVSQAIGYKNLERRYYDFIMRSGGFYYKDRLGHSRGPMELIQLKTAWGAGIIDKHTFVWGEDMDEWAPIGMIYGMERAIATWEVRLGAAATAFLHKLQKGIPPWVPLKGHESKTYKQLQEEAIESKRRDLAVLEANDGTWPGLRTPSHALFLWASGSELSSVLEADHMPNCFVPKDLRLQLGELIPGLRPWQVLTLEQMMDWMSYGGKWYREHLGAYTTGPPHIRHWNEDVLEIVSPFLKMGLALYNKLEDEFPDFDKLADFVTSRYKRDEAKWQVKRKKKEAIKGEDEDEDEDGDDGSDDSDEEEEEE